MQNIIWSLFGKKYLLGGAVEIYKALTGYRTQIATVLTVIVYVAKILGWIPHNISDPLIALLTGAGGITMAEKLQRWDNEFKLTERVGQLKADAIDQLNKDGVIPPVVNPPLPPELK
jgi:hypothetical protein